jgi:transposase
MSGSGEAAEDYRRRSRRSWSLDKKLAILEDLATSGDPLAEVARRHGMNAHHLLTWRSRAQAGTLERRRGRPAGRSSDLGFVRVDVAPVFAGAGPVSMPADDRIEVELPGGSKIRFGAGVDPEHLCGVLRAARAAL